MKASLYKTDHLYLRAWERGINQSEIDKISKLINPKQLGKKSRIIIGKEKLKQLGIKTRESGFVFIAIGKALITAFPVDNIFNYLKSQTERINTIIL